MMQIFRQSAPAVMVILALFLGVFAYTKLVGAFPLSVVSTVTSKTDVFTVSGEGRAVVKPDIAYVSVGVQANGATVKEVQTKINEVMKELSDGLKKVGIEATDMRTTNYNINPNYDWSEGRQRIVGYVANTNVRVKVKDIDRVNEVIDTATASGANEVGGVSFDVDDKGKAEDEARAEAVEEAKKKAEQAAKIAGFRLGKIVNYTENFNGGGIGPMMYGRGMAAKAIDVAAPAPETEIAPGSSEVVVTVSLSYQLE